MPPRIRVHYVTSSQYKIEETNEFSRVGEQSNGKRIGDVFEFRFHKLAIPEVLEVNLEKIVKAEVIDAYRQLRLPCLVEHAGLIFKEFVSELYPGGLTKPMWNTLGDRFISETNSANRPALARAVIGYCDGMDVRTFTGETEGKISGAPRGDRKFYWDTVFEPFDPSGQVKDKTYAEIVADPVLGLSFKVKALSQSTRALAMLLQYLLTRPRCTLWRV